MKPHNEGVTDVKPLISLVLLAGGIFALTCTHTFTNQDTQLNIQDLRLQECLAEYRGFREGAK